MDVKGLEYPVAHGSELENIAEFVNSFDVWVTPSESWNINGEG
jgi:hypothetical protein